MATTTRKPVSAGATSIDEMRPVALALWAKVGRSRDRIVAGLHAALDLHANRIHSLASPDSLGVLIPTCLPNAFLDAAKSHVNEVLNEELKRRSAIVEALSGLAGHSPSGEAPVTEPLSATLIVHLQALRGDFEQALKPVKDLQEFVKSPTQGQVGARLAARGAGMAFGGLVGIAVAVVGGIIANQGRKSKLAKFARRLDGGAHDVVGRWKTLQREHVDQALVVADFLFFRSLEPLAMEAIRVAGPADVVVAIEAA